ncbi:MAG: hypothetical protein WAX89_00790 [Alphaproteobacteria bacterium]
MAERKIEQKHVEAALIMLARELGMEPNTLTVETDSNSKFTVLSAGGEILCSGDSRRMRDDRNPQDPSLGVNFSFIFAEGSPHIQVSPSEYIQSESGRGSLLSLAISDDAVYASFDQLEKKNLSETEMIEAFGKCSVYKVATGEHIGVSVRGNTPGNYRHRTIAD